MLTCLFRRVIFKETLVIMCLASVFWTSASWKFNFRHHDICYAKKLKYFSFVWIRILVEKWHIYEDLIFPGLLVQTCWLETISLCLNIRLRLKKLKILIIFIKNKVTVLLLWAHPLMTSSIFHSRKPNRQGNFIYILGFCFSSVFIKNTFSHCSIMRHVSCTKDFQAFEGQ